MHLEKTGFGGLYVLNPQIHSDERGYFFESFSESRFSLEGINYKAVQENESNSKFGVIRGLHFQKRPHEQAKIIRVIEGKIRDVVVDLRQDQKTFGQLFSIDLDEESKKQLLVPKGFAHGFSVLSPFARILYLCDNQYQPNYECGINYADPELKIDWGIPESNQIVSEKDKAWLSFKETIKTIEGI